MQIIQILFNLSQFYFKLMKIREDYSKYVEICSKHFICNKNSEK